MLARAPTPRLSALWGLARPYTAHLAIATASMLVGSAVELAAPRVGGAVLDAAIVEHSVSRLDHVLLALVGLFAILGISSYFRHVLLTSAGARMLADARARLVEHLLALSPAFHEQQRVGDLMSRIGSDLTLVASLFTGQVPSGLQSLVGFVGTLALMLVTQPRLTLVMLALVPPYVLATFVYGRRVHRLSSKVQDATAETAAIAEEALAGLRTVQSFQRERAVAAGYRAALGRLVGLELARGRVVGGYRGFVDFGGFGVFAVVGWAGARAVAAHHLSPGELAAFLMYTMALASWMNGLGNLYGTWRQMRGATERVFAILDEPPAIVDAPDARPLAHARGALAFEGVRFAYPSQDEVARVALDGIDLAIRPGELVGLVGPSGAGKSTLLALLSRFYDPTAGTVRLDGEDLRALRLADVRRAVAIVPQDLFLCAGTVEENLRFGGPDAPFSSVEAAAIAAGADGFIRDLPGGYQALVGERGVKLSAGQRQRIAIARAFLKDPAVLLLDEATSALDAESEELVQRALTRLFTGRTTLVVAHRLATARRADRILVLERGRIIAQGSHEALQATSALYRRYWELQSLGGELPLPPIQVVRSS